MPLSYCLTRQVKDPAYGTPSAGCMDFFVPEFDDAFMTALGAKNPHLSSEDVFNIKKNNYIRIKHGEDICIPSGVHMRLEPGTALTAFNKSGIATRLKLIRGAEYVDSDYCGELHLHVINAGMDSVIIEAGMKLVQFSYVPVYKAILTKHLTRENLYADFESVRGENWQGSTGMK